jgi:hypothetical protein
MSDELAQLAKALEAGFEQLEQKHGLVDKALEKNSAAIAKKDPPRITFKGLVGAYMDVIKKSDGLTAARPATLKAIQGAEKAPDAESIKRAVDEMKKHVSELEKASKKERKFVTFDKNMTAIIKKTEALIG